MVFARLRGMLSLLPTPRFIRYAIVGCSGVLVNMGAAIALHDTFGIHFGISTALAIETAVLSNFALNQRWTFKDRQNGAPWHRRLLRFQLVSAVGMALNYTAVMLTLVVLLAGIDGSDALARFFEGDGPPALRYLWRPIVSPPTLDFPWAYLGTLVGTAVAMFWNFFANLFWTWREDDGD